MSYSKEQLKAIKTKSDNNLLLAGPGTGKSYTILGYIDELIKNKDIKPNNIFILTFTRTATADLKKKIQKLLVKSSELPKIFTLHGFALRQLLRNSGQISVLPKNFSIADDFEERYIILEDLKSLLNINNIKEVKNLLNLMASNWETLNADTEHWEQTFSNPEFIGAWQEHREIFGYVLRSELVYQFKNMLENENDIRMDGPIQYLIVDEYQDLNKCDLSVIHILYTKGAKLYCAGDDDQSIYGFRYAYPEGIRNFKNDIPDSEQFPITECRRCDEKILKLAEEVIRQDFRRIPKKLKSITGSKGDIYILRFINQIHEAKKIAQIIYDLVDIGITVPREIIILIRSDFNKAFSSVINSALQEKEIPINSNKGLFSVLDSNIGRFFVSIVKLLDNNNNDLAIRNLLLLTKGIGVVTLTEIYNRAKNTNCRFHSVVSDIVEGNIDDIQNYKLVKERMSQIYKIIRDLEESEDSLENIIKSILTLCDEDTLQFENDILKIINDLELQTLPELLLAIIDLFGPAEPVDENADGIRIMSMHQAKGLTADIVFIVASEDEYIPGRGEVDEERRLFYVSLTRARHKMFICYCNYRTGQQRHTGFLSSPTTRRNLTRYLRNLPTLKPIDGSNFNINN